MPDSSVDQLRQQLRQLGYLSHGIERWYEHDPWRSRTFWSELLLIAGKHAILLFAFLAAPLAAVMSWRNRSYIGFSDVAALFAIYALLSFAVLALLTLLLAAVVRVRAGDVVERPRLATIAGASVSVGLSLLVAFWWRGFPASPDTTELLLGGLLLTLFLFVSTISMSAALLSLSIWTVRRIPAEKRPSQQRIILVAAAILIAVLLAPIALRSGEAVANAPQQVVTTPRSGKLALLAVDGLSHGMASAASSLTPGLTTHRLPPPPPAAPPELWASIGTGVPPFVHRVRAIEGVRLANADHVLQAVSSRDVALRRIAPFLRIASREALPPTARSRDFVWETIGARGVSAASLNWWASEDLATPLLRTSGQSAIFVAAKQHSSDAIALALNVDRFATVGARAAADRQARFITTYLPALDVLENRLSLDEPRSATHSRAVLKNITHLAAELRSRGYELLIVGVPGKAGGHSVIASSLPFSRQPHLGDIAPTVLDFFGFPASDEMTGASLLEGTSQERLATYGDRRSTQPTTASNEEYFESLKSLGYINP